MRVPQLRLKNGQYSVRIKKHDYYLGRDKKAAEARYKQLLAQHLSGAEVFARLEVRFSDILIAYLEHIESSVCHNYFVAVKKNCGDFGALIGNKLANAVKPADLVRFREQMATEGRLAIRSVNRKLEQVKRVFRYAVETGMVDVTVYQALAIVENAKLSTHKKLKPPKRRPPVPLESAVQIIGTLRPIVRDLLLVQLYSGSRPGEINRMRKCDVEMSGDVWIYHMKKHKTALRTGSEAVRYLGKRCQAILQPRLQECPNGGLVFANKNGNVLQTKHVRDELQEACKKAGVEPFCPYQLRHTAATIGRKIAGLDGAQALLGHQSIQTTEIYAERVDEKAVKIAREFG